MVGCDRGHRRRERNRSDPVAVGIHAHDTAEHDVSLPARRARCCARQLQHDRAVGLDPPGVWSLHTDLPVRSDCTVGCRRRITASSFRRCSHSKATRLLALVIFILVMSMAEVSTAQVFDQLIVFGDSTVDSGYFKAFPSPGGGPAFNLDWTMAVAAGAGKPTSSPGLMSSELLAL